MDFMSNLKSTLNNECNVSVTENGAVGYRTTGKALLDLNFSGEGLSRVCYSPCSADPGVWPMG